MLAPRIIPKKKERNQPKKKKHGDKSTHNIEKIFDYLSFDPCYWVEMFCLLGRLFFGGEDFHDMFQLGAVSKTVESVVVSRHGSKKYIAWTGPTLPHDSFGKKNVCFSFFSRKIFSGQFIINPYPNLRPFWGGFPY